MPEKKDSVYLQVKQLGIVTTIPILLLLGPSVGFFVGRWIDQKFQIYPWMSFSLALLGLVAVGREISQLLRAILKEQNKKD